jgi:hypothetical protein
LPERLCRCKTPAINAVGTGDERTTTGDATLEASFIPDTYFDLADVTITRQETAGTFTFIWILGASVPAAFGPDDLIEIGNLNINPRSGSTDYAIVVRWAGSNHGGSNEFEARLFGSLSTDVLGIESFSIEGPAVKAIVSADALGNPESFKWIAVIRNKSFDWQDPFDGVTSWLPFEAWGPNGGNASELGTWKA